MITPPSVRATKLSLYSAVVVAVGLVLAGCSSNNTPSAAEYQAANETAGWQRYGSISEIAVASNGSEAQVLADMIAHHQDAIDGSQALLTVNATATATTTNGTTKTEQFAQRLVRVQQAEVDQMSQWLTDWYPTANPVGEWTPMFADVDPADEAEYLRTMIEHHHHAVVMYTTWANSDIVQHPSLGRLLSTIAKAQETEIVTMCQMLGANNQELSPICVPKNMSLVEVAAP